MIGGRLQQDLGILHRKFNWKPPSEVTLINVKTVFEAACSKRLVDELEIRGIDAGDAARQIMQVFIDMVGSLA